jgi:iron complex outermembrane receptor protein
MGKIIVMSSMPTISASRGRAFALAALFLSTASAALALAAPAAAQAPSGSAEVEEVIVTAQRREERLQNVPVAVTVVSGDQLAQRQTYSAESLVQSVPSLTFRKGTTNVNSALNIRGIGTISFSSGSEPAVSTVVDGVVLARSGQAFFDFFDIERIEVLRGPQGTLFGKNASAGVVSIVTKHPSATPTGFIEGSAFEGNEYRLRAGVSGPITDTLGGGLTAVYGKYDGNAKNRYDGSDANGYERFGVRGKLEWKPTSDLTVTGIADWVNGVDNASADIIGFTTPGNAIIGQLAPVIPGPKNRDINNDVAPVTKDSNWGVSGQVDYNIGDYTLTSITAYRGWGNTEVRDGDFTSSLGHIVGTASSRDFGVLDFHQFSQEVRLASPTDQFISYVVGAYYYHTDQDNFFNRLNVSCTATTLAAGACATGSSTFALQSNGTANFNTQLTNYAAFGQATVNFTDKFRGIVGLREGHDKVEYDFARVSSFAADTPGVRASFARAGSTTKEGSSGRLGLQYDVSPAVTTYVNYARGYKGPAINVFFNMQGFDTIPLSPETSNAYEAGVKSKLFENRLVLNVAAFDTEYKGFQTTSLDNVLGSIVSRLINAGDVSTKGVEADFTARPTQALTLSGGAAYTKARIDKFNCPAGSPASCAAHDGKTLPYAPKWKANLSADYQLELPSLPFDMAFNASYVWQSDTQFDIDQNPLGIQKGYGILDAGISLVDRDGRYRLSLVGKNLGDQYYTTAKIPGAFVRQQAPRDAERYFGVVLRANFGG